MTKYYFKKIAIFLVITLGVTLLPSIDKTVFADDKLNTMVSENNSGKEEATIVNEVEELREEYSKQFLKSDGTFEVVVYNKPIHYKDGDKWVEIDNSLKEKLDKDLEVLDENTVLSSPSEKIEETESINEESIENIKEKDNGIDVNQNGEESANKENKDTDNKNFNIQEQQNNNSKINEESNLEKSEKIDEIGISEGEYNKDIQKEKERIEDSKRIRKDEVNNILTNKNNDFTVSISKYSDSKKLINIFKDGYELSWGIENANPVKYENVIKDNNSINTEIEEIVERKINENNKNINKSKEKIEKDKNIIRANEEKKTLKNISTGVNYKNIFKNVDLNYTIDSNIVKENIIIKDKVDIAEFEFSINTKNLIAKQSEHGIKFYDINNQEKEIFSIEKPYMYDKKGDDSRDIKLEFKETKDGYKLKLIANKEWINSKDRTYPIVIDPIVNTSQVRTDIFDTFVRENDSENKYANQFLRVGNNYGSVTRSYLKFNIPSFDTANTITGAYMNLALYNAPSANQINVHKVTSQYSTSVSNGYVYGNLLWSNMPSYNNRIEDYEIVSGEDKWVSFDITRIVKEWYTRGVNNGLMLKSNDESISDSIFWSSDMHDAYKDYRPVIQYNYINNSGLESYWTYHSQDVGRLGTGYINDYNGNLLFVQPLTSDTGNRMPVNISLIYNSKQKNNKDINGDTLGFGNGWRLNLSQRIVKVNVSGEDYYKYIDSDGTEHYFKYEASSGKYKDLSGLDLILELNYDNGYLIKDKKDNKYMFTAAGYLYKIEDTNKNTMTLQYEGTKLKYIVDGVGRRTTLDLLDNGYLVGITDSSGRKIRFGYNGIQLNSITYPDNKMSIINYDSSYRL